MFPLTPRVFPVGGRACACVYVGGGVGGGGDRPGGLNFVNLLPNYGMDPHKGWAGDSAYQDYIDAYIATYAPRVLCFDHYPWFEVGDAPPYTPPAFAYPNTTRDGYRRNLLAIRAASLRHHVPFWNYFNTIPFQGHRDPTYGELAWQVFTSLAFGAKGILWFTYWDDPDAQHFGNGNAVITRRALPGTFNESSGPAYGDPADYVKGPHWFDAKRLNSVVLALATWLLGATSTSVHEIGGAPTSGTPSVPAAAIPGGFVASLAQGSDVTGAAGHYLVGQFVLEDGRLAVLLQNQDPYVTQWPVPCDCTQRACCKNRKVGWFRLILFAPPRTAPCREHCATSASAAHPLATEA